MRSTLNWNVVWPRLASWGALVLLTLSVYQCGEVPIKPDNQEPVLAAVAKTATPATVASESISAGLALYADEVEVGDEVEGEVFVDLSGSGASLGAYEARLSWDAAVFSLIEVSDGTTAGFASALYREETGALVFSQLNARGADGRVSLLRMRFSVIGNSGSGRLNLAFTVLTAAHTFASLLPSLKLGGDKGGYDVRLTGGGGGGTVGEVRAFSLPGGASMEFVWIEPGVFQMGSDNGDSNEKPVHEVEISTGFWLGKYEVTVGQFRRFVEATGYDAGNRCMTDESGHWEWHSGRNWRNPGYAPSDDHPVVCVSWADVSAYAAWLSRESGALYRLPSEAEWEYACRAGTQTRWSFGDDASQLTDYAWYWDSTCNVGECHIHAVGGKLPNPWGLYDMHGNVWEWVNDWYGEGYYNSSPRVDPPGPLSGFYRVFRGGFFTDPARVVRSAIRYANSPGDRYYFIGVRLARGEGPGEGPIDPPEEAPEEEPPVDGGDAVGAERTFSLPGGASMEFVWISPGVFQMGSPESERSDCNWCDHEGPVHEVEISTGFWLGKYEVTQGEWEAVMGNNPSFYKGDARRPVEQVSWYDVHEFIGRVNDAAGDSLYRLPSEAEWEYACRAGSTTRWSFGDDESVLGNYAWYGDNNSPDGTKAVGGKLPNGWGLYDMHGNVVEWVQDWYSGSYYNSSPRVDPPGPSTGSYRVSRGSSFVYYAPYMRSAIRLDFPPVLRNNGIGVRLVRLYNP